MTGINMYVVGKQDWFVGKNVDYWNLFVDQFCIWNPDKSSTHAIFQLEIEVGIRDGNGNLIKR